MSTFKYHIVRYNELTGCKQWLCWDGTFAVATNSAAGFPSVRMARRHVMARRNVHTIALNCRMNELRIEGPRGGYYSIFPKDRNEQIGWEKQVQS